MIQIEIIIGVVVAFIGSVTVVVKNIESLSSAWTKNVKIPCEERRQRREDESHAPILKRIEKMEIQSAAQNKANSESLEDIKGMLHEQNREKHKDRQVIRATAMALVSLYTDINLIGVLVRFEGQIYRNLLEGNSYSPSAYPAGWELVEEIGG